MKILRTSAAARRAVRAWRAAGGTVALVALAGRPISADEVADRLWPGLELEVARRRLRNVVSRVRAVGPVVEREADRLRLAPGVVVDAERFTTTAERVLARHEPDPVARQITEARAALTLWGGPLAVPGDAGGLDLAAARLDRLHAGLLDRVVSVRRQELRVRRGGLRPVAPCL